jgi:hypothetical protein
MVLGAIRPGNQKMFAKYFYGRLIFRDIGKVTGVCATMATVESDLNKALKEAIPCVNIKLLSSGSAGKAFLIKCSGRIHIEGPPEVETLALEKSRKFIGKETTNDNEGVEAMRIIQICGQQPPPICRCQPQMGKPKTSLILSDNFANQTIIGYIVNHWLWDVTQCCNSTYIYDSWMCGNTGWNMMNFADKGELGDYVDKLDPRDPVSDKRLFCILIQIIFSLRILQEKAEFNHNDLTAKNVFLRTPTAYEKKNGITYEVDMLRWDPTKHKRTKQKTVFTVKILDCVVCLADFDKSNATYNGWRFGNRLAAYKKVGSKAFADFKDIVIIKA